MVSHELGCVVEAGSIARLIKAEFDIFLFIQFEAVSIAHS